MHTHTHTHTHTQTQTHIHKPIKKEKKATAERRVSIIMLVNPVLPILVDFILCKMVRNYAVWVPIIIT